MIQGVAITLAIFGLPVATVGLLVMMERRARTIRRNLRIHEAPVSMPRTEDFLSAQDGLIMSKRTDTIEPLIELVKNF